MHPPIAALVAASEPLNDRIHNALTPLVPFALLILAVLISTAMVRRARRRHGEIVVSMQSRPLTREERAQIFGDQ